MEETKEKMSVKELRMKLTYLRRRAYSLKGSYEDSYAYLMNGIDKIIGELK